MAEIAGVFTNGPKLINDDNTKHECMFQGCQKKAKYYIYMYATEDNTQFCGCFYLCEDCKKSLYPEPTEVKYE